MGACLGACSLLSCVSPDPGARPRRPFLLRPSLSSVLLRVVSSFSFLQTCLSGPVSRLLALPDLRSAPGSRCPRPPSPSWPAGAGQLRSRLGCPRAGGECPRRAPSRDLQRLSLEPRGRGSSVDPRRPPWGGPRGGVCPRPGRPGSVCGSAGPRPSWECPAHPSGRLRVRLSCRSGSAWPFVFVWFLSLSVVRPTVLLSVCPSVPQSLCGPVTVLSPARAASQARPQLAPDHLGPSAETGMGGEGAPDFLSCPGVRRVRVVTDHRAELWVGRAGIEGGSGVRGECRVAGSGPGGRPASVL